MAVSVVVVVTVAVVVVVRASGSKVGCRGSLGQSNLGAELELGQDRDMVRWEVCIGESNTSTHVFLLNTAQQTQDRQEVGRVKDVVDLGRECRRKVGKWQLNTVTVRRAK